MFTDIFVKILKRMSSTYTMLEAEGTSDGAVQCSYLQMLTQDTKS